MRVIEAVEITGMFITFDGGYPSEYTRYGPDNWVAHYGMSDEYVSYPKEMEVAYQNFIVDFAS